MFALIEEDHSEPLAAEITSVLLNASEGEILHMLRSRDALDCQVGATSPPLQQGRAELPGGRHVTFGGGCAHASQQVYHGADCPPPLRRICVSAGSGPARAKASRLRKTPIRRLLDPFARVSPCSTAGDSV